MSGSQSTFSISDLRFTSCTDFCSLASAHNFIRVRLAHAFIKVVVAHQHRRRAATGQAFDELDGELAVLRRLQAMLVRIQAQLLATILVQLVAASERTTQRAADLDLIPARWL